MNIRRTLTIVSAMTVGFVLVHAQEPKPTLDPPRTGATYHIYSGDRLLVRHGFDYFEIGLFGISCPQRGQPLSKEAKKFTRKVAAGKVLTLRIMETTKKGLLLAEVLLPDGKSLNEELLRAGLAWCDRTEQDHGPFLDLEVEARSDGMGLWSHQAAQRSGSRDGNPNPKVLSDSKEIMEARKAA